MWYNPMSKRHDHRSEYIRNLKYHMWSKGLWDQRIVDGYFQLLMDIDNPNVLAQAVTTVLLVLLWYFIFRESGDDCNSFLERIRAAAAEVPNRSSISCSFVLNLHLPLLILLYQLLWNRWSKTHLANMKSSLMA